MEAHELHHHVERAHEIGHKGIGLTTAIVAVLLAVATMLGNRTHVLGGKLETQIADQWSTFNSKHSLTHNFSADMQQAEFIGTMDGILANNLGLKGGEKEKVLAQIRATAEEQAKQYQASGAMEDREADEAQNQALEMERRAEALEHSGDIYNLAELFLQISIVLCSIALLADSLLFWRISFVSTLAGVALVVYGVVG